MSWISSRSSQESLEILGQLSEKCAELGGPLTRLLNQLVKNKDYNTLVAYEIDYRDENLSVNDAIYARQILGFFQKLEFLELGFDRDAVAASRFVKSERICLETNTRFELLHQHPNLVDADVMDVLYRSQRKIAAVLGPCPSLEQLKFEYGSGANTNVKSALACPRAKLGAHLECSTNLLPHVAEFLSEVPALAAFHDTDPALVWRDPTVWYGRMNDTQLFHEDIYLYKCTVNMAAGKVMFVSKNARTNRTIVIEPPLNTLFQKGVGTCMKEKLLASGINLYDQSINQKLALLGSVTGEVATEDAKMASDCVARQLVWDQLPFDWASLCDKLRTPSVMLPDSVTQSIINEERMSGFMKVGRAHLLEKFSSMGCAFTFELESVLFYGLCFGVVEALGLDTKMVSIYGDDMIVPSGAHSLLTKVLSFCGFSLNLEKSFAEGPFRESCGADYFHGFDIRPFYQKTQISGRTLFTMHNWFIRSGERELAALVLTHCNTSEILWGPDGYGDGHLIGHFTLSSNRQTRRNGWDGGTFDTYKLRERRYTDVLPGDCVLPVYSVYTRSGEMDATDPDVVRGSNGYQRISIYTLTRSIFAPKRGAFRVKA